MPAPTAPTYSAAAKVAAHTAFRDLLDAGTTEGLLRIRDAADLLLVEFVLTSPCGTVNGTTGQLTITAGVPAVALADSSAAYGEFCDSDGAVHLAMPCEAGIAPVSGKIVLNTLVTFTGAEVELLSATVG